MTDEIQNSFPSVPFTPQHTECKEEPETPDEWAEQALYLDRFRWTEDQDGKLLVLVDDTPLQELPPLKFPPPLRQNWMVECPDSPTSLNPNSPHPQTSFSTAIPPPEEPRTHVAEVLPATNPPEYPPKSKDCFSLEEAEKELRRFVVKLLEKKEHQIEESDHHLVKLVKFLNQKEELLQYVDQHMHGCPHQEDMMDLVMKFPVHLFENYPWGGVKL